MAGKLWLLSRLMTTLRVFQTSFFFFSAKLLSLQDDNDLYMRLISV